MIHKNFSILTAIVASVALAGTAQAGIINSSSFNALTNGAVDTSGTLDWGYVSEQGLLNDGLFDGSAGNYNNLAYGSLDKLDGTILTTVDPTSAIGTVAVTEGQGLNGSTAFAAITFDAAQAYGGVRSLAPAEDAFTVTFNDLGIGTFNITLYLGHSNTGRTFNMNYSLLDGGGAADKAGTTASGAISGLGSTVAFSTGVAFTYDISVTTATAGADLSLNFDSTGGSSGDGLFAGYTVDGTIVPEPASLALLGLGGVMIARRK